MTQEDPQSTIVLCWHQVHVHGRGLSTIGRKWERAELWNGARLDRVDATGKVRIVSFGPNARTASLAASEITS